MASLAFYLRWVLLACTLAFAVWSVVDITWWSLSAFLLSGALWAAWSLGKAHSLDSAGPR